MRPILLVFLALPVIAACAMTPRQQCEAPYRAELRAVTGDISDTTQTLARGFRLVPARFEIGRHFCLTHTGFVRPCRADDDLPMYDKRPINRAAETAKLKTLGSERARLDAAIATCRARYPE